MSEATVPRRTRDIHSREAQVKAPQRAPPSGSSSAKFALCGGVKGSSLSIDNVAYAASVPKALPRFLAAKLELRHYSVLIPSAGIKGAGHRPTRDPKKLLRCIV